MNETYKHFEPCFLPSVSRYVFHSKTEKLPGSMLAQMLLQNSHVFGPQRTLILSAVAFMASNGVDPTTDDVPIMHVTHVTVVYDIKQFRQGFTGISCKYRAG